MRLFDLCPSWIAEAGRHGQGIVFVCPVHGDGCHLWVPFANPIDGGAKGEGSRGDSGPCWWQRTGDTFEALTLTPSIHVKDVQPDGSKTTHWHGFITNGEVS